MSAPEPVYRIDDERVERLLGRLRNMFTSHSGGSDYNQGLREGIRSAALAVREELDTQLINTLSGPPVPTPHEVLESYNGDLREVLAQCNRDELRRLGEAAQRYDVDLSTLADVAICEHEFEFDGVAPNGDDTYSNCLNCDIDHEFLTELSWPLGTVACKYCTPNWPPACVECGRGIDE